MKSQRRALSHISNDSALSDFEKAVLKAVCDIPAGEVRPYGWVAKRIGRPRAARAVGNALNKNKYAPVIPCHRVVRSDGSLGGYSGGISLKKRLLASEGVDVRKAHLL